MKLFVISDIHGSLEYLKNSLKAYENENADMILILGDILYHGPRNPIPNSYDPKAVAKLLNKLKNKIIAVRGNCDSEVDQMILDFPIMADFSTIFWNNRRIFVTHGHLYNRDSLPNLDPGDVFVHGHTHIPSAEIYDGVFILNPGSVTFPKENHPNSYGIFEGNSFKVISFENKVLKEVKF
ncbi:phosphodiesterase [uncultured Ilyobacter sp.]|uniref:phosphodiesterase n=1 Tax=uncultured Ilyobacter sp. TaxID=544433 RepID=UPI0029C79650|nr:phosphodiesterase [uncultured Ilyobacter sp.]